MAHELRPAAADAPAEGYALDPTPAGWRVIDAWCRCLRCGESVDLTLYVRRLRSGPALARLEPRAGFEAAGGLLRHRRGECGGILRAYGLPERMVLEDSS